MERVDVVVVGAGAAGSSTAWHLARRGRSVALLERFGAGHDRGSSHGGSRIFRLAYADGVYVRLARAALAGWRELEEDVGEPLLDVTGALDHGTPASVEALAAAMTGAGVAYEVLPAEAAAERWPGFRFDGGVLWHAEAGRYRSAATVAALQRRVAELGAEVRFDTRVEHVAVRGDDDVEVHAGGGSWRAQAVVVAAGAWAGPLLGAAGVALPPLEVTQEVVSHFPVRGAGDEAGWPSFIHHRRPWTYGLGTPGEGVKVAEHHVGPEVDPDDRPVPDPAAVERVRRYVEAWLPGLEPEPASVTTCLYSSTASEDFVLDRAGPVVVGSPCSGHGFKFTPEVGRLLADLAEGRTGHDRFALASVRAASAPAEHR